MYDYGFELPDTRHSFYTVDGSLVTVKIIRHWEQYCDDEPAFQCSFDICHGTSITHLPIGHDEHKAIRVAHLMYKEDIAATKVHNEIEAEIAAEIRMGA